MAMISPIVNRQARIAGNSGTNISNTSSNGCSVDFRDIKRDIKNRVLSEEGTLYFLFDIVQKLGLVFIDSHYFATAEADGENRFIARNDLLVNAVGDDHNKVGILFTSLVDFGLKYIHFEIYPIAVEVFEI